MGFCLNEKVWRESDIYLNSVFHRIGYMEEKYEAESFARSFLMPKDLFRNVASSNREPTTGHYIVRNIASYFNIPKDQVRKRGIELSIFEKPCLFRSLILNDPKGVGFSRILIKSSLTFF